ncbi:MAG: dihydroneopterin triphosphate diphosphatase [Candidatus Berkiella sp.]
MTKRPESVLVVVYTASEAVLLLQRRDHPDFWQSVTGSLEIDESKGDAALRELYEETGLSEASGVLFDCHLANWFEIYPQWRHRYGANVTQNLEHVFSFVIPQEIPITLSHEHLAYRWLAKEEALKVASSSSNQTAIKTFVRRDYGRSQ